MSENTIVLNSINKWSLFIMVGLGNALSTYAYYYLYSMYQKKPFIFTENVLSINWKSKGEQTLALMKKDKMLRHLPLQIQYDSIINIDQSIALHENIDTCGLFFHLKSYGILENIHHIRPLVLGAMIKFEHRTFSFHKDDVVIHVRTGDIFSNKHEAFYSSIHFCNYIDLLKDRQIHNIYIVWKSDRKQDREYDIYNTAMITHLQKYLSLHLGVSVITERQECDDFVFMTQAPYLIACISTYSMWAALLNTNNSVIPQCKNHFNNRLYNGDHFKIIPMYTVNRYKKDITQFCNQFTEHHSQIDNL